MDIEFNIIKKHFNANIEYTINDTYEVCKCDNSNLLIVKSGVGKLLAARCTKCVMNNYSDIECIYSAGIAGAISDRLNIGDIIISNSILDYSNNSVLNIYKSEWKYETVKKRISEPVYSGKIICSDLFIDDHLEKARLFNNYSALCVEMESAGVIKECINKNILFKAVKVISDHANNKAEMSILRTVNTVTNKLGKVLFDIIGSTC